MVWGKLLFVSST